MILILTLREKIKAEEKWNRLGKDPALKSIPMAFDILFRNPFISSPPLCFFLWTLKKKGNFPYCHVKECAIHCCIITETSSLASTFKNYLNVLHLGKVRVKFWG